MTISKAHIIDQIAQNVFGSTLPPSWPKRKQHPDYHIDYFVEIEEASEPSGLVFGVQLKGTSSPNYSKNTIKQQIKTKHLAYYIDRTKEPVFIVIVDTQKQCGYWLFVQEWIRKELSGRDWRQRKKVTVKIPTANKLELSNELYLTVKKAEKFMREIWPCSIASAALYQQKQLESLDDRFRIDVSYSNGGSHFKLLPKKDVKGTFRFSAKSKTDIRQKISDLLERGVGVEFAPGEFQITGSKLFEKISEDFASSKVVVKSARELRCQLSIFAIVDQKHDKPVLQNFTGQLTGGTKEIRLECQLPNSPITVKSEIVQNDNVVPLINSKFSLNYDLNNWAGQSITHLSYFDAIWNLVEALKEGMDIRILWEVDGNPLFAGVPNTEGINCFLDQVYPFVFHLHKARIIANYLDVNPKLPAISKLSNKDFETVHLLWTIITQGEYRQTAKGSKASTCLTPKKNFKKSILEENTESASLTLAYNEPKIEFWGYLIPNWTYKYIFTNVALSKDSLKLVKEMDENHIGQLDLSWEGTDDAELIIKIEKIEDVEPLH